MDKFVPVVVIKEMSETDKILTALQKADINCAEITFRTACAAEAIKYAREKYPTMNVGAGTVINAEQCKTALEAGAQFIVSPGLSVAVAEICKEKNIPYYPIPIEKNKIHYQKYQEEASKYENLYLLGRLANYKYINMDVAVKNAMELFDKINQAEE